MSISFRGVASGLDINKILEELMYLERAPIRRKEAQIERAKALQECWQGVNLRVDALHRSLSPLTLSSTFNARTVSSSNSSVITATLTGHPLEGSYSFDVEQLATVHRVTMDTAHCADPDAALGLSGTFFLGTGEPAAGLEKLTFHPVESGWLQGNLSAGYQVVVDGSEETDYPLVADQVVFAQDFAGAEEIRIYVEEFTAGGEDALQELQDYYAAKGWDLAEPLLVIRKDSDGVWRTYNQDGTTPFAFLGDHPLGRLSLRAEAVDGGQAVLLENSFSFHIRDELPLSQLVTVTEEDSLNQVARRINEISEVTGVRAQVVKKTEGDYRLVLESLVEGKAGAIQTWQYRPQNQEEEQAFGTDNIMYALGILQEEENGVSPNFAYQLQEARDARFRFNELLLERSANRIDDLMEGVVFQLHGTGTGTVSVVQDTDAIVSSINAFVGAYNEALSLLRDLQTEENSLMAYDMNLMRMEHRLRSLAQGRLNSLEGSTPPTYGSLAEVGITTSGKEGFLQVDEAALRNAVQEDAQAVFNLFGRIAPQDEEGNKLGSDGLARQLQEYTASVVGFNGFINNRQDYLQRSIRQLEQNIQHWELRLAKREQNLIRQFTFMEQYISRMQDQSSFFQSYEQMLGGGAGE